MIRGLSSLLKTLTRIGEGFALGGVYIKTVFFQWKQQLWLRQHFPGFCVYQRAFKKAYRFSNPFHICKQFLKERGYGEADLYGETPFPLLARIVKECHLSEKDHVLELGCGRAIGCFFISFLAKCRVTGVDWIPTFIQKAESIAKQTRNLKLNFLCQDMEAVDLSQATCVYLYGTCLDEATILLLVRELEKAPLNPLIVTVSYPLNVYSSRFCALKQWTADFEWGEGEIYVNQVKADS